MAHRLTGKYYLKNSSDASYADVTTLFDGVVILSVNGFDARGKALNVYTAQWIDNQTEDFTITTLDANNNPVVIRENVDITVVFAISQRYANGVVDAQTMYDTFINYMTASDIWVASKYVGKQVRCFAMDGAEPKTVKLKRGDDSYILGEIKLHTLSKPTSYS